ncbi:MAG TPA: MATE family efflux transporter, partial [Candidatus Limnocylindrales bacterium]|nr:MATE family efflux transporter [Candidatus Limnocylindrales bacterium]
LVAQVATIGLGTVLMGELSEHHAAARSLVSSSVGLSALTGAILGTAFILVAAWIVPQLGSFVMPAGIAAFALGVAVTASGLVTDQALLGLRRGGLQLVRNGLASVVKLAALVGIAVVAGSVTSSIGLFSTWVVGSVVSLLVLLVLARRADDASRPIWRAGEGIGRLAVRHHLLNLSILAPGLLLPLVVTATTSAETNAYFYIPYVVASFIWAIPAALATAVYAAGARDVDRLAHRVRLVFALSLAAGIATNLVLLPGAQPLLSIFGRNYASESVTLLRLFGLGIFPITLNSLYVPIVRVERKFLVGTALMLLSLVIELAVVAIGASRGGLAGAGLGWLIGYTISVVPFIPAIVRVALRRSVRPIDADVLGSLAPMAPPSASRPSASPSSVSDPSEAPAAPPPGDPRGLSLVTRLARARSHLAEHDDWTIGVVDRRMAAWLTDDGSPPVRWLPRRPGSYAADPFGLEVDGVLHVLFEEFDRARGRGVIAHVALDQGDDWTESEVVLDTGCHASYPFLVESDGEVFMVPETADLGEVRLYRALDFPRRWSHEATLLHEPVSDPTLVRRNGRWWLFGTSRGRGVNEALRLWHAPRLEGPWKPHRLDPVKVDRSSARPGGTPFVLHGALYRPGQDNSGRYGGAVVLNRVDRLTVRDYEEVPVARVLPLAGSAPDGLHTLSRAGSRTLIDGNRVRFVPSALRSTIARLWRVREEPARPD